MAKPPPINLEEVMAAALKALKANRSKVGGVVDEVAGAGKGLVETITKAVKGAGKASNVESTADRVIRTRGHNVKLTQADRDAIKQGANPKNPKAPPKDVGRAVNAEEEFVAGMQPTTAEVWKNGPALDKYASKNGPDTLDAEEYATLKLYNQFIKAGKTPPTPRVPKNPPAAGAVASKPKSPKPKSPKSGTADAAERAAAKEAKTLENKAAWAIKREEYNAVKRTEREARKAKNKADWAQKLDEKYGGNIVEAAKATSKSPSKANRNRKKGAK